MSKQCIIDDCPGNARRKKRGEKIYYFKAPEGLLDEWSRVIPGNKMVQLHDKVCSRHFNDEDLIKEWNFVIDDKTVTMPRGRWTLKIGAVPAIFNNYHGVPVRSKKFRKTKPTSFVERGSSDEEEENPVRKRRRLSTQNSPKAVEKCVKSVPQAMKAIEKEPIAKSDDQTWEKACDNFVNQLSSLGYSPTGEPKETTKRGPGRPRKYPKGVKKLSSRGRGRPRKVRPVSPTPPRREEDLVVSVSDAETESSVIIEQFVASGCDTDPSSESDTEPAIQQGGRVLKRVRRLWKKKSAPSVNSEDVHISEALQHITVKTEKYSGSPEPADCHCVSTEDSALSHQPSPERSGDVVVKREICECEGENPRCCEPQQKSDPEVQEVPTTPIPCEMAEQPMEEAHVVSDSQCSEDLVESDSSEEVSIITPALNSTADAKTVALPEAFRMQPSQAPGDKNQTPTPGIAQELNFPTASSETFSDPLPTSKECDSESDDLESDFLGFSSDEEQDLIYKRNMFKDSAGTALKSTNLYFDKLNKKHNLAPDDSHKLNKVPAERQRKSSMEIAMDQLKNLSTMACSIKPEKLKNEGVVEDSALKTKNEKLARDITLTKDNSVHKYDDVLKNGRISDEVTVTKASNVAQKLDKVTPKTCSSLDKVTPSPKFYMPAQTSKLTPSVSNHLKEPHLSLKTVGTSTSHQPPLRDKIHNTFSDRLAHLMNGSSLDRILQSPKVSLLDSVCDPSVDKTSVILKNFKSDGVLALECVVLKEQVRQLQKELFLHKQMLIDSEHNASLLQRKLELQAQLPCINCVNIKRGFVGKETLI